MHRPARRSDGEQTHEAILHAAMRLASVEGLGSLTFGRLARELDLTKSGVFAHFRSREQLQQATIDAAQAVFDREVIKPGMAAPEGVERLEGLCEAYLSYIERRVFPGGCFFAHLLAEFDAPEGPMHDELAAGQRGWLGLLTRQVEAAQRLGQVPRSLDPSQLAFEAYAPIELANYLFILFDDPSLIANGRRAVRATIERASSITNPAGPSSGVGSGGSSVGARDD